MMFISSRHMPTPRFAAVRRRALVLTLASAFGAGATFAQAPSGVPVPATDQPRNSKLDANPQELQKSDVKQGSGVEAVAGKRVVVHYSGWLYDPTAPAGKGRKFDSSRDRGTPFDFSLGRGEVIRGWDDGVAGMKIGGQRTLVIPPQMGYGARGAGGVIPPNATLIFDVELLDVK